MNNQDFMTGEELGEKLLQAVREMQAGLGQMAHFTERQDSNYTEWRRGLWAGKDVAEIANIAKELERRALERKSPRRLD
ncbi:hypothetical protein [Methylomagnum sp.]